MSSYSRFADSNCRIGHNCVISETVTLGRDVRIGNNAILDGDIIIGDRTRIDDGCTLRGKIRIGSGNWICPYGVIGTGPQHILHPHSDGVVRICDNNVIREFATIHRPTQSDETLIGSGCYIMAYPHIAHDCIIQDKAILTTRVTLGGHVTIEKYANIGQGTQIHPYCMVGQYCMIGQGSSITKDVPPFALMNRQVFTKINRIGLERNGVSASDISGIHQQYQRHGLDASDNSAWYGIMISEFVKRSTRSCYVPQFAVTKG